MSEKEPSSHWINYAVAMLPFLLLLIALPYLSVEEQPKPSHIDLNGDGAFGLKDLELCGSALRQPGSLAEECDWNGEGFTQNDFKAAVDDLRERAFCYFGTTKQRRKRKKSVLIPSSIRHPVALALTPDRRGNFRVARRRAPRLGRTKRGWRLRFSGRRRQWGFLVCEYGEFQGIDFTVSSASEGQTLQRRASQVVVPEDDSVLLSGPLQRRGSRRQDTSIIEFRDILSHSSD